MLRICPLQSWLIASATLQMCFSQCRNVLVQKTGLGQQLVCIIGKEFTSGMHTRTTESSYQTQHIFPHISHNVYPTVYPTSQQNSLKPKQARWMDKEMSLQVWQTKNVSCFLHKSWSFKKYIQTLSLNPLKYQPNVFILYIPCQAGSVHTAHTWAHICRTTTSQTHQSHIEGIPIPPRSLEGLIHTLNIFVAESRWGLDTDL